MPRPRRLRVVSRRARRTSCWFTVLVTTALLAASALPTTHAAPRLFAAPSESWAEDSQCATAFENRHELADDRGGVCSPFAVDTTTGCCLEPKMVTSKQQCAEDCSEKSCCDSYARCVVCCHTSVEQMATKHAQLPPVSHMHPGMWRGWLVTHSLGHGGHGGETVRGESHQFPPGEDDYQIRPFAYCAHRCRTSGESTKYENEYQNNKHHCFGVFGVEAVFGDDTLSPGRELTKLHDEAGDFRVENGQAVALGLVKSNGVSQTMDGPLVKKTNLFGVPLTGKRSVLGVLSLESRLKNQQSPDLVPTGVTVLEVAGVLGVGYLASRRWRNRSRATKTLND